jgi:hypothetical protein
MTAPTTPRFGISGRSTADHAVPPGDADQTWQFSTQWEMLELLDGSLFFDSVYADHRCLQSPPAVLRRLLRSLEREPATSAGLAHEAAGDAGPETVAKVHRLLAPFVRAGIVVPQRDAARPAWVDDAMAGRFATQLEWLATLSPSADAHWTFFERLRAATVVVLGAGGVGSLLAQALVAVGVGRLVVADGDTVESSNLVRQILYYPDQEGRSKAGCLAEQLRRFSPYTEVQAHERYVEGPEDLAGLVTGSDVVAVCADAPRFVLNRWIDAACKQARVPYLGALAGLVGPMYRPGEPGCFGCVEHRFREELGPRHDMLVDALAAKTSWRYPAFVSGPLAASHLMTTDIVLHLTGAAVPASAGGVLRTQHPHTTREPFPGHPDCDCAPDAAAAPAPPADRLPA